MWVLAKANIEDKKRPIGVDSVALEARGLR